jgi:hypothetical protein
LGRCCGAQNGRLPWQLQQLFKIKQQNDNGAFVEYWVSLAITTIPDNMGTLDPVSKIGQLRNAPAASALPVAIAKTIAAFAHVIPEIPS